MMKLIVQIKKNNLIDVQCAQCKIRLFSFDFYFVSFFFCFVCMRNFISICLFCKYTYNFPLSNLLHAGCINNNKKSFFFIRFNVFVSIIIAVHSFIFLSLSHGTGIFMFTICSGINAGWQIKHTILVKS